MTPIEITAAAPGTPTPALPIPTAIPAPTPPVVVGPAVPLTPTPPAGPPPSQPPVHVSAHPAPTVVFVSPATAHGVAPVAVSGGTAPAKKKSSLKKKSTASTDDVTDVDLSETTGAGDADDDLEESTTHTRTPSRTAGTRYFRKAASPECWSCTCCYSGCACSRLCSRCLNAHYTACKRYATGLLLAALMVTGAMLAWIGFRYGTMTTAIVGPDLGVWKHVINGTLVHFNASSLAHEGYSCIQVFR